LAAPKRRRITASTMSRCQPCIPANISTIPS
jgi:hypothetical protein